MINRIMHFFILQTFTTNKAYILLNIVLRVIDFLLYKEIISYSLHSLLFKLF